MTRAEKVRQAVEFGAVRYSEKSLPRITISFGVAYCPAHEVMPQDLPRAADEALHTAKDRGRNQVQIANSASFGADIGDSLVRNKGAKIKPSSSTAA